MKSTKCKESVKFEDLIDFVEGRLAAAKISDLERHLASGCKACQKDITFLQRAFNAMQKDEQLRPDLLLLERIRNAFRASYGRPSLASRLKAALVFDSRSTLAFGMRSPATRETYQLLYRLDGYELDLQVLTPSVTQSSQFGLIGQLLPFESDAGQIEVVLISATGITKTVKMSESGEFEFQGLVAGKYQLEINLATTSIEVEKILIDLK
jgi:hypothetical protein